MFSCGAHAQVSLRKLYRATEWGYLEDLVVVRVHRMFVGCDCVQAGGSGPTTPTTTPATPSTTTLMCSTSPCSRCRCVRACGAPEPSACCTFTTYVPAAVCLRRPCFRFTTGSVGRCFPCARSLFQEKFLKPFWSSFHGHEFVMDRLAKFLVAHQVRVCLRVQSVHVCAVCGMLHNTRSSRRLNCMRHSPAHP